MEAIHNEFTKSFIDNNVNKGLFCFGELFQSEGYEYALTSFLYRMLMYCISENAEYLNIIFLTKTNDIELEKLVKYCLINCKSSIYIPIVMFMNRTNRGRRHDISNIRLNMERFKFHDMVRYLLRSKRNMGYLKEIQNKVLEDGYYTEYVEAFEEIIQNQIKNEYSAKKLRVLFYTNILKLYNDNHIVKRKKSYNFDELTHQEKLCYKHKKPSIFHRRMYSLNLCLFESDRVAYRDIGCFYEYKMTRYWEKQKDIFKKMDKELGEDFEERWSLEEKGKSNRALYKSYRDILFTILENYLKTPKDNMMSLIQGVRDLSLNKPKTNMTLMNRLKVLSLGEIKKNNITPFYDCLSQCI